MFRDDVSALERFAFGGLLALLLLRMLGGV